MKVMVINSGSSSIKYKVFDMNEGSVLASGLLERIGEGTSSLTHSGRDANGEMKEARQTGKVADHRQGLGKIVQILRQSGVVGDPSELAGIGHRVVHGGEDFKEPTLVNDDVVASIRRNIPLAPLHNPANLIAIEAALEDVPHIPQVAVFDTAFHQSIPPMAFHYAIPYELYSTYRVRRYGFHGTSHQYVATQAAAHLGRSLDSLNLITLHLGNGASVAAIEKGRSVDTSMGLTPLEGLIMGTRSGDIDPAIHFYLLRETGQSPEELESLLNKQSGLKGICGVNDMREVQQKAKAGDERARLAIDMYCYRIKKYIGAYFAVLGIVDALVFTAGIGEHSAQTRDLTCQGLAGLGIVVDPEKNRKQSDGPFDIQAESSSVKILVIPTDEELQIAQQTFAVIQGGRG
jgi:acetate kinase